MYSCLSVYLSIHLSFCLSVNLICQPAQCVFLSLQFISNKNMSVYLSICLSLSQSVSESKCSVCFLCPSVCPIYSYENDLSVLMSIFPPVHPSGQVSSLSVSNCVSVCLYVCPIFFWENGLSVCLSICPSIWLLSCLSVHSVCLSFSLFIHNWMVYQSVCVRLSVCSSVQLSVYHLLYLSVSFE
jgi:hypothetical protein